MNKESLAERLGVLIVQGAMVIVMAIAWIYPLVAEAPISFYWIEVGKMGLEMGILEREDIQEISEYFANKPKLFTMLSTLAWFAGGMICGILGGVAVGIPLLLLAILWMLLKELVCQEIASGMNRVDEIRRDKK